MKETDSQRRAVINYRARLLQKGHQKLQLVAPVADGVLLRAIARRLIATEHAADGPVLRAELQKLSIDHGAQRGGILGALRASPLVGALLVLQPRPTR